MKTFTIKEVQNISSIRDLREVQCKNLTAAKIKARTEQSFSGTELQIWDEFGNLLVYTDGETWKSNTWDWEGKA